MPVIEHAFNEDVFVSPTGSPIVLDHQLLDEHLLVFPEPMANVLLHNENTCIGYDGVSHDKVQACLDALDCEPFVLAVNREHQPETARLLEDGDALCLDPHMVTLFAHRAMEHGAHLPLKVTVDSAKFRTRLRTLKDEAENDEADAKKALSNEQQNSTVELNIVSSYGVDDARRQGAQPSQEAKNELTDDVHECLE